MSEQAVSLQRIWWERFWTTGGTVVSWWCVQCDHESRDYIEAEKDVARAEAAEHDATHDVTQPQEPPQEGR